MVLLWGPTGWRFLISEVPLYRLSITCHVPEFHCKAMDAGGLQGYLAHKKTPTPLRPP